MRTSIPFAYPGVRTTATVPDTLDLAERAALAINGFVGLTDPALDSLPYGLVHWASPKPHMSHWSSADVGCGAKVCESFPLMRLMCGSTRDLDVEATMRADFLARVQDGLFWDLVDPRRPWRNIYNESNLLYGPARDEDFCVPAHAARMLRAVMVYRQVTGDAAWDATANEMVRGLRRIAVDKGDYSYYPEKGGWAEMTSYPRSGWINTDESQSETEGTESSVTSYHAHQIYAASVWHQLTGDPVALDLAARLSRYSMRRGFWGGTPDPHHMLTDVRGPSLWHAAGLPDPAYTAGWEQGHWFTHFHARATSLRGMLEYARASGDQRVLEFVRRAYEFTLTQGIPRMGFVNCYPGGMNVMEGCALGDLVALGIRLTDTGIADYWDDVDAITRNHLVEQQIIDADQLTRIAAAAGEDVCRSSFAPVPGVCSNLAPLQGTGDQTIKRTIGIYAGSSLPSVIKTPWSMICCTGNGTQGLYYAWEATVRETGDMAQINLLLNRAARLLDIDSYIPYEGRVVIHNKAARRISVRIPSWVDKSELRVDVGGTQRPLDWVGRFIVLDDLRPGAAATLRFPVRETTERYTLNANTDKERVYSCTFRGSTLVDITPRDDAPTNYRIYQRAHMRSGTAPMKTKERFVADAKVIAW
jgi:hypothetical protein